MNEKMNIIKKFSCNICNKLYSSQSSLCNHNKKFHNNNILKKSDNILKKSDNIQENLDNTSKKIYSCRKCDKVYYNIKTRWSHEQKCNKNNNKIEHLEHIINKMKKEFKLILQNKTQKINNQLNNINNGVITSNNTYVKFGEIDYEKILNSTQIKNILDKQYKCLEESIKQIHFNKNLPEYNNVFITNMKDDIAYIFDGNNFITVRKNEMLNELIDFHTNEINLSLDKNKNKLNEKYVSRIEHFINKLNDGDTKFIDHENQRIYSNYKAYKINSIKLLIYNESDKKKLDLLTNMELKEKI